MEGRYDRFTTMIAALYQNIQKVKMLEMENFDLRTIHATCLHHFSQHPSGLTLKELTELCEVDKAAMSRCVAELQEKGLVHSDDVSTKKYNRAWKLTDRGEDVAEETNQKIDEAVNYVGSFLREPDRAQFYLWLTQITGNLEEYVQKKVAAQSKTAKTEEGE